MLYIYVLRNNGFPTATGGKGADTSIVSSWLEHVMDTMVPWLMSMCVGMRIHSCTHALVLVGLGACHPGLQQNFVRASPLLCAMQQRIVPIDALAGDVAARG